MFGRRLLLGALLAAGCSRRAPGGGAPRIVSLSPSTTETLFAIGAGALVVARSRYCNFPPEVAALPVVGGFVDASLEGILGLSPSLVVGARGPGGRIVADALESRGIPTYFPETESIAQIEEMIRGLGARASRVPAASALVDEMRGEREGLSARVAAHLASTGGARPRVLLLFGLSPLVGAGAAGFPDEMLTLSGCENALRGPHLPQSAYPTLSLEQVLVADPDTVLLTAAMGDASDVLPPIFSSLRAVRTGRVRPVPGDEILRPGPRLAKGQRALVRAVHPALAFDGGAP